MAPGDALFRLPSAARRSLAVEDWLRDQTLTRGGTAARWFDRLRACGDDVRDVMHDGCPTACVGDAAFAYVAVHRSHINVGFFRGSELDDPGRLLEGTGRRMRHVKLRPGADIDEHALEVLIDSAYVDMKQRLAAEASSQTRTPERQAARRTA